MAIVKSKLLKQLSDNYPNFLKKDLERSLNIVLNEIKLALNKGENVELRDFGTWSVQTQKARLSRNPKTGEKLETPKKKKIRFKMSKKLFKKVLSKFSTGITVVGINVKGINIAKTINSFTTLSISPPLVLFSLDINASYLNKFKKKLDPRLYNGAIFLGLDSPVVKSHGSTDSLGFSYSLNMCEKIVKGNLIDKIKQSID